LLKKKTDLHTHTVQWRKGRSVLRCWCWVFFGRASRVLAGSRLPQCVVDSLFSPDELAGCGPAAGHLSASL